MSIDIVPENQRSGDVGHIPPMLLPQDAASRYAQRAARLQALAAGHVMGDYLQLAASIVNAQQHAAQTHPLPANEAEKVCEQLLTSPRFPLASSSWKRSEHWQVLLDALLDVVANAASAATPAVQASLNTLRTAASIDREALADALLHRLGGTQASDDTSTLAAVDGGQALLLWSALSVYWSQLAASLPAIGKAQADNDERHLCPMCGHAPIGSVVLAGSQTGVRYLHCSLCESRWHIVRSKCSCCTSTGALDYWSLDDENAAIKAESCGDCHSYLKAFYLQTDPALELVADDLASLALDAEVEREGFARSGFNPLLTPS